jgi:hypothetical protein
MRLQIPAQTPLAFITLVGACGGAQSSSDAVSDGMVSLQCEGDALSPDIIAELGEHGFVDATFTVATERSEQWLVETRAVLDRLAARLSPIEGSDFGAGLVRAGEILVLTDSELTDATELLLITRWSESEIAPAERPDPASVVGYTTAVLQCSAGGLWEPLAHHDLAVTDAFAGITGVSTGDTQQGRLHTVMLREINPYTYVGEQFDFAIVLGNDEAQAESASASDEGYAYLNHFGRNTDTDWGPLTYVGQLYSVGYGLGAYGDTYDSLTGVLPMSAWFPILSDTDGSDAEYSDVFLAMRLDEYYSYSESEYEGYSDFDDEDDQDDDITSSTLAQIVTSGADGAFADVGSTRPPPDSRVFINLFAVAAVAPDNFRAFPAGLAESFVLVIAPDVSSRCEQNGWSCTPLSASDVETFAHTELAATRVVGVWTSWQTAALAADTLGLRETDYLILGPDPRLSTGHRLAYFGNDGEDFLEDPDRYLRELHPRLRHHIEYRR